MPRATAAEAAATAARVLDAAEARFIEHGFTAASVDEIAVDAGVTRGAVYHHYVSKPGLFLAVMKRMQQQVADAVVAAADASRSPSESLRIGSHAFLDAITANGRARVLLVDAPRALGWDAWRQADAEASGAHLSDALRVIDLADADVAAATALLSGAMNEAALWLSERPRDAAARESAHRMLDVLLDAVLAH